MPVIHVAVGIIVVKDKILVAQRSADVDQGGLWEFPGGKVEPGETVEQALKREMQEEIGITVVKASPLIQIQHAYPGKDVLLDVWKVEQFLGKPTICAGQTMLKWVRSTELTKLNIPAANHAIVKSILRILSEVP
jgi:8-oxo-dGTP diphosphatase